MKLKYKIRKLVCRLLGVVIIPTAALFTTFLAIYECSFASNIFNDLIYIYPRHCKQLFGYIYLPEGSGYYSWRGIDNGKRLNDARWFNFKPKSERWVDATKHWWIFKG